MAFKFGNPNLYSYDVFPKVVPAGKAVEITIKPLGSRREFVPGQSCTVTVKGISGGNPVNYPSTGDYTSLETVCAADGALRFVHTFSNEQEYFLDISFTGENGRAGRERFSVYCVENDLAGLYPFIGDLHIHTTFSDGSQDPEIVCAVYRGHGYDFMAVTDHKRYYPSLKAINTYRDLPVELNIIPGEEVHMPAVSKGYIEPHIVNFGGEYSVNALVERDDTPNIPDGNENRSLTGICPDKMSIKEFEAEIDREIESLSPPEGIDPIPAAGVKWICSQIRKANGLAIYAHPTWISDSFHVPDALHDYIVEKRMFDAFEVLGGENYFEQNGYQTIRYYEDTARGCRYPVVGSTDSHSCYPTNRNAYICSTIVFAPQNERESLIEAVKDFRSVAVDTISAEFRVIGETRLSRYACFLLKNYFPIHDEACAEEGRMMKQYVTGSDEEKAEALAVLGASCGRMDRLRKKYFLF